MNNYARNFHDLRVKMDIKQNKIAEDLGKSPQAISHWEAGNSAPTLDDLIKVAEYFNVSLELLVRGEIPEVSDNEGVEDSPAPYDILNKSENKHLENTIQRQNLLIDYLQRDLQELKKENLLLKKQNKKP